ncbi:MAG TPA: alpha/beta fold hydrolase [Chthonomonadales bacterium]|nr:alpha/beta fold hydrolase [Chthonomonadales bacterium]
MLQMNRRARCLPILVLALWGSAALAQTPPSSLTEPTMPASDLFGYDSTLPLAPTEQTLETTATYKAYSVSYYSTHDLQIPAVLVIPVKSTGKEPAILLMHGLGGDKMGLKFLWSQLAAAGFVTLAIDAEYHGDRKPREPLTLFGREVYTTRDLLAQTVIDLRRGIDYLQSRPEVDPDRIGYIGFSMGGILGAILCGVDSRVKAPVLALAGGDWKVLFAGTTLPNAQPLKQLPPDQIAAAERVMDPVDPIHWIARIAPRPVLFVNGDADTIVPVPAAKELQAAARQPKESFWYKGGHVPIGTEALRVGQKILAWIDRNLKGGAAAAAAQ